MRTEESNAWIHIFIADNSLIEKKTWSLKFKMKQMQIKDAIINIYFKSRS